MINSNTRFLARWAEPESERGIATITVAFCMIVVLGIAALAVDGSNLYRERSDVQNAADLAAYAAAYDDCTSGSNPASVGLSQAAANGYDDSDPNVTVAVAEASDAWQATITSTITGFFAKALGSETLTTTATAVAKCDVNGGGGAYGVFAGGECESGNESFSVSGQNNTIVGALHSNGGLYMSGQDWTVGTTTYAASWSEPVNPYPQDASNTFGNASGEPDWSAPRDWPFTHEDLPGGLSFDDFVEGSDWEMNYTQWPIFFYSGDVAMDSIPQEGIHIVNGSLEVKVRLDGYFTFIVLGGEGAFLKMDEGNQNIKPALDGILLISDGWANSPAYPYDSDGAPLPHSGSSPDCDYKAIMVPEGGENSDSHSIYGSTSEPGLVFAPRGQIEMGGQYNTIYGSVVSYSISYGGSNLLIDPVGMEGGVGGLPVTVLMQ